MKIRQLAIIVPGLVISAAAFAAATTQAQTSQYSTQAKAYGLYVGAMGGWSNVRVNTNVAGVNYWGVDRSNADGTVANLFVGYKFNRVIGAELGVMNFHNHSTSKNINAEYVAAKLIAPIANQLSVYGKLGVFNSNLNGVRPGVIAALGGDYNVTQNFAVGPEVIYMRQDTTRGTTFWNTMFDTDVQYTSVGVQVTYTF